MCEVLGRLREIGIGRKGEAAEEMGVRFKRKLCNGGVNINERHRKAFIGCSHVCRVCKFAVEVQLKYRRVSCAG